MRELKSLDIEQVSGGNDPLLAAICVLTLFNTSMVFGNIGLSYINANKINATAACLFDVGSIINKWLTRHEEQLQALPGYPQDSIVVLPD